MTMNVSRLAFSLNFIVTLSASVSLSAGQTSPKLEGPPGRVAVAISYFAGEDRDVAALISDGITNAFNRSSQLAGVIGAEPVRLEIKRLGMEEFGPYSPQKLQTLGAGFKVNRLLIGRFLVTEGKITIRSKIVYLEKRSTPPPEDVVGVSGNVADLDDLVLDLAESIHIKLLGVDISGEKRRPAQRKVDPEPTPPPGPSSPTEKKPPADGSNPPEWRRWIPAGVHPDAIIHEKDLYTLAMSIAQSMGRPDFKAVTLGPRNERVDRLRFLIAMAKLTQTGGVVWDAPSEVFDAMPEPKKPLPEWGKPFVSAAVTEGWIAANQPFEHYLPATWKFAEAILEAMPIGGARTGNSSLVIDALNFEINRNWGPKIRSEGGLILYPDQKHLQPLAVLYDDGMAEFVPNVAAARRAGANPLIVKPIRTEGPFADGFVVSNQDAERILLANKSTHFLWKWKVSILTKN